MKTCQSCRHWFEAPRQRGQLGGVDLSIPRVGECREQLHIIPAQLVQQHPGAPPSIACQAGYAQGVPADFPACGRHAPLIEGVGIAPACVAD